MSTTADVLERRPDADARIGIIDTDIHPYMKTPRDLDPYLSARWRKYLSEYDKFVCGPYAARGTYPRFSPNTCAARRLAAGRRAAGLRRRRSCASSTWIPTTSRSACWNRC